MSWPRQGSQNPLDNRECKWKTWISWVWGFEVVHAVKGSFEVALPQNDSRVCTLIVGKPAHLSVNHDSTWGWPRLGLLTLPTAREREQVRGAREERCYALVCMSNHPDLTANHLPSF